MKKIGLFLSLLFLFSWLFGQNLNITYPTQFDSFTGQILNIPIICENTSNLPITIYPDYFNIFQAEDTSYRLNRVSPRVINPGRRELIFLSLAPNNNLLAGVRRFPFVIRDERESILKDGLVEINHIVNEEFAVIPLDDSMFIISEYDLGKKYFFLNRGSVPIEFRIPASDVSLIIQPGISDTLFINFSKMTTFSQNEFWVSYSIDYTLTKILPDDLIVEHLSIRKVVPIANLSSYPYKRDFYRVPVNFTQSFTYDEAMYAVKNITRHYVTTIYGNGFIDEYPAPYLNFYLNLRHIDYEYNDDTNFQYNLNYRTNSLNLAYGQNAYILDLKRQPRYGTGLEIAYFNKGLFLERVFLKESYGQQAIHNRTSIGYSWGQERFLFEPEQYIRLKFYQKNNQDSNGRWANETGPEEEGFFNEFIVNINRWLINTEHEKVIFETQFNLLQRMRLNMEAYMARDNITNDLKYPGLYSELLFQTPNFYNRFSMFYDVLETTNEPPRRIHYNNVLKLETNILDIYSQFRYRDEHRLQSYVINNKYFTHNFSTNIYLFVGGNLHLRYRVYDTATNFRATIRSTYTESEQLFGFMVKKPNFEYELLYGANKTQFDELKPDYYNVITLNTWITRWEQSNINMFLFTRATFDDLYLNIDSQFNLFNRWTDSFHHSIGTLMNYHSEQNWRNSILLFSNLYFTMPWKHHLTLGGTFNINPTYNDNSRYSVTAEYSIPFDLRLVPKSNKKYMTLTFLDQWERKPVRGAVFEMDNRFFVSNDAGIVRMKREDFIPQDFNIINLPTGLALTPDFSSIVPSRDYMETFRFAELSRVHLAVKKHTYQRVLPHQISEYQNIAYYQNTFINIDNFELIDYSEPVEIILRNIDTGLISKRETVNELSLLVFTHLQPGNYEILINDSYTVDDLVSDLPVGFFSIGLDEKLELEIVVKERYTSFSRFQN